jgi:lysophospholipase L1-like esterase
MALDPITLAAAATRARTIVAPTKRAFFVLSTTGGVTTASLGRGGDGANPRFAIRLPVATTRWRLRIRNYNTRDDIPQAGQVDFTGAWIGPVASIDTGWDGKFAATPTQALTAFTTADLQDELVTDWVTDPAAQTEPNRLMQVGFGYIGNTSGMLMSRGYQGMFYTSQKNDAGVAAPSPLFQADVGVFDVVFEYEANTDAPRVLVVADSLTQGRNASGVAGLGGAGSWCTLWGSRSNALVTNAALSGSTLENWQNTSAWKLTRWAAADWDAVVVALGTNNIENGDTLATIKTRYAATLSALRTTASCQRIFAGTIPPRVYSGDDAAKQVIRLAFNDWIETLPLGITGTFRIDQPVINPASTNTLLPTVNTGDGTHINTLGQSRMANVVPSVGPLTTR